jgi:hypothetical protein
MSDGLVSRARANSRWPQPPPREQRVRPRRRVLSAGGRIVASPMNDLEYVYELRQGEEVVATGRLSTAQPLEVGERVSIGGREGIVRTVEPMLGLRELRLVVQLVRDGV